jgi:hypothetical protein
MMVHRDPFARDELHKEPERGTCAECGGSNRYGKVWRWRLETDGGRVYVDPKLFCSRDCKLAYYGG